MFNNINKYCLISFLRLSIIINILSMYINNKRFINILELR